jgi:hypothetical protein
MGVIVVNHLADIVIKFFKFGIMKIMEKIKIQIKDVPYIYLDFSLIEGEIGEVSKRILSIKNDLKKACDLREKDIIKFYEKGLIPNFTPFKNYQYIYLKTEFGYDLENSLYIEVWRDETDEEYNKRLQTYKKIKESAKTSTAKKKITNEKNNK